MSKPRARPVPADQTPVPEFDADLLPQALLLIDEQSIVRNANRTWSSLYFRDVEASLGQDFFQYIHPKERPPMHRACEKLWETGSTANCIVRILDGANAERWSDVYLRYHNVGDKPYIAVSVSDVNERVGEERLLLAHHRSINSILNDLPGMVYRCRNNPEWPMEYVSEGCIELTGYEAKDIVHSRRLSYGSMIIEEDQESVWEQVQNALREHRRFELVYRIKTARSEIKWVWEKGKGIYSAEGELSGIEGFITDYGRRMVHAQTGPDEAPDEYVLSESRFVAELNDHVGELRDSTDSRLLLFCIHLDHYERYLAGVGYDRLVLGQRHIAGTLGTISKTSDLVHASQPNQWFVMQRRHAGDMDIEGSAEAITDAFLSPISLGDRRIYVSVSIGCVVITGSGETDPRRCMRLASRVMNTCHAAGGGTVEILHL